VKRTKSDPIQFRLMLEDYAVLEHLAAESGRSPKDYVVDLVLVHLAAHRDTVPS
jgi:uncharacterized protein (DUF1778 family)